MSGSHLGALVEGSLERRGDAASLVCEGRRLTGTERLDTVRRLTGGLVALGLRPGDRVMVCLANGPEVEATYAAVWRAGAVVTPVVFLLSEAELRHVLVDSGAVMAVTSPELLPRGDIGHLDPDGFLVLVDRKKDLIIRSGMNVFPRDVEEVLLTHPDVAGAAVVGRPDPVRGEEIVAFLAPRPGAVLDPDEVVDFARGRLSGIHRPHEVRVVDAIPLTSVGKTDRKALRARLIPG
jgi:acyl-CoA synthetase (AMP-forming)/AMP-acid ligase II